jgi:hypothetical protein
MWMPASWDRCCSTCATGVPWTGEELPAPLDFTLGSGVESLWGKKVPKQGLQSMETMKLMGAGFFLTTPVFDLEQFHKFMRQIGGSVPVIAEVLLLRNAAMARFINRHFKAGLVPDWVIQKLDTAPDKTQASIELFADLAKGLRSYARGCTSSPWAAKTNSSPIWMPPICISRAARKPARPRNTKIPPGLETLPSADGHPPCSRAPANAPLRNREEDPWPTYRIKRDGA